MVRTARFSADTFVRAAIELVAVGGANAASTQAIARKAGAPTGSMYHRFASRSAILATAWIATFADFSRVMLPLLQRGRAREAALAILPWAAADPHRAKFFLLHESAELFDETPPPHDLCAELKKLEDEMEAAFDACLIHQTGEGRDASAETAARARFLIFDAPIALLRPYLTTDMPIPHTVNQIIAEMHAAVSISAASDAHDHLPINSASTMK